MVEAQLALATPVLTPLALAAQHKDVMAELLADQRSPNTRSAYAKDLKDFFGFAAGVSEPSPELVAEFLGLERFNAVALVLKYKAYLLRDRGLKEATVNRRLAALKALVNFARQVGKCNYTLSDVKSEKVVPYRDTTGISKEAYRKMLAVPDLATLKGQRDYAILRLLWDNALRREELVRADLRDLDLEARSLLIIGKGKGTQKEAISLSGATVQALQAWLLARQELDINRPLFIALDRASCGHRLTGTAVYKLVESVARAAGINKKLSPHRIRHSGITAALDATGGDVRRVQKLSRHASLDTLMIYDDNRKNVQGEISDLLAGLV